MSLSSWPWDLLPAWSCSEGQCPGSSGVMEGHRTGNSSSEHFRHWARQRAASLVPSEATGCGRESDFYRNKGDFLLGQVLWKGTILR